LKSYFAETAKYFFARAISVLAKNFALRNSRFEK